ncbi:glycoside hydrolase family 15 protein [Brevibacillus humidisoli]|uniref:glycoside hydrolase family 15 protein n=1 Tax=Brevibacillus humidisoli TaxID=2895522 RepID=UPI001E5A80B2|nr:glycoside hydrolase family 15 protein [Brevibacillus humidisoli]UFJ39589.1 glycoside hydrolase family 15 protein [Brevibacillus humidisoli]
MERRSYYGFTGNGETAVLIHPTLSIDWMCIPRFDGFPIFAKALDPLNGGKLVLSAMEPLQPVRQQYLGRTNVLQTEVKTSSLTITAVDYMPWGKKLFIRDLSVQNRGQEKVDAPLCLQAVPTQTSVHTYETDEADGIGSIRDGISVLVYRIEQEKSAIPPGETISARVVLAYGNTKEEAMTALASAGGESAEDAIAFWENWLAAAREVQLEDPGWKEAYWRSLLALKLLCVEQTGAILAAPTASFPAVPHGGDNWDYRYAWLRDGYYTAHTLDLCGLHAESRRFYEYAFRLQEADGSWRQPLYTIDGDNPAEMVVPDMAGPNGERPVRFGNLAADQLQLDNNGNIVHGVWCHYRETDDKAFLQQYWTQIKKAVDWQLQNWDRSENGIWEIRERQDHWLHGKAMSYACFEAGANIAQVLGETATAQRWRDAAAQVKRQIIVEGWNEKRGAYLQSYSADAPLDISVLALLFYGVVEADDPKLAETVRKMEQPLFRPLQVSGGYTTADPFAGREKGGLNISGGIARYDYAHVPFYLPTIWLARYYLLTGNRQRAKELIDTCISCATDLLLMAEHFHPRTREQWGNFPQAFSHEEMARILLEWSRPR